MKVIFAAVFAVFALTQVQCQSDKQKELLAQHYKQCLEISKVDQNVLQKARQGEFANDAKLKEHILCITRKTGFQNDAGELQREVIKRKLKEAVKGDETKTNMLMESCAIANPDPKIQAFNAFKCIWQKAQINLL